MIDSNNNDTEIPEDLPEEQASQLIVKDFAARSKAKSKPQRREPVDYSPSIIPMNEWKWIDIEPGNYSLSAYEVSKKVIHLLRHSQQVQREEDGDLNVPRRAQYLQCAWKKHQGAVYWVDIDLAIRKIITFYQTRSNSQKADVQFSVQQLHFPGASSKAEDMENCRFTTVPIRKN